MLSLSRDVCFGSVPLSAEPSGPAFRIEVWFPEACPTGVRVSGLSLSRDVCFGSVPLSAEPSGPAFRIEVWFPEACPTGGPGFWVVALPGCLFRIGPFEQGPLGCGIQDRSLVS